MLDLPSIDRCYPLAGSAMERLIAIGVASLLVTALAACSSDIGPGSSEYGAGSLGNGGFAYTCDESVKCGESNSADPFPTTVSLGGKFTVRYVPRTSNQSDAVGITVGTVGTDYFTFAVGDALVAKTPGFGTLVARDRTGTVVDFQVLKIAKPTAIAVFAKDVEILGDTSMSSSETRLFRATARAGTDDLAGVLNYEWTVDKPDVIQVNPTGTGSVNITGRGPGSATLTVTGGTLTQTLTVTVE